MSKSPLPVEPRYKLRLTELAELRPFTWLKAFTRTIDDDLRTMPKPPKRRLSGSIRTTSKAWRARSATAWTSASPGDASSTTWR